MRRTLGLDDVADGLSRKALSVFWMGFVSVAGVTAVACMLFVVWGAAWLIGLV